MEYFGEYLACLLHKILKQMFLCQFDTLFTYIGHAKIDVRHF